MPTPGSPSSSTVPPSVKRGRFVLFCIWTLIVFGGGLYLGNSATKNAMKGPEWLRRMLGVYVNAPNQPIAGPNQPGPNAPAPYPPVNPPIVNSSPGGMMPNTGAPPSNPPPAVDLGFFGSWISEEDVMLENNTSKKVVSVYTFNKDGSGDYSVDGQKTADIKWENAGDMLNLTFTSGNGSSGRFWKTREKWFANPEKTLLTLVPQGAQDANAEMGTGGTKTLKRK